MTKKSVLKLIGCSILVAVFSSFVVDECKPTDDQVRANCEYSSNQTCTLTWIGGACDGKVYYYPYNRAK